MVFVTLGEALESALASMMNDGDGAVAAAPDACKLAKSAGTEAPASTCREDTVPLVQEDDASRCGPAGNKRARPTLAAGQHLVVIEGGRPARGGGSSRVAYAQARGGNPASNLRIVGR